MTQVVEKRSPSAAALEQRPTGGPAWLQAMRDQAAERFAKVGFPTVRNEEWRFTNVSPIANADLALAPTSVALGPARFASFLWADAPHRLVFVNGRFSEPLSRTAGLPAGVRFGSLAEAVAGD